MPQETEPDTQKNVPNPQTDTSPWTALPREAFAAARLLSRLPIPEHRAAPETADERGRASRAFPLIGLALALVLSAVWWLGATLFASTLLAALLTVAAALLLTGAMHEDGLADTADALGAPKARREAVRRDPRLGTYAVVALSLTLLLRVALLAEASGFIEAMAMLIFAETFSRAALAYGLDGERETRDKTPQNEDAQTDPQKQATAAESLAREWRAGRTTVQQAVLLAAGIGLLTAFLLRVPMAVWLWAFLFAAVAAVLLKHSLARLFDDADPSDAAAREHPRNLNGDALGALQQGVLLATLLGWRLAL